MKPHKRNGRAAKKRRQETAKDRQEKGREFLKKHLAEKGLK